MTKKTLNGLSATELASMLQAGEMTAVELAERYLNAIAQYHDQSIFIKITKARALAEAEASDARRLNGTQLSPWDGIPIAWKDLFDTEGDTTTAGSKVYANANPAKSDAATVAACRDLGLVCLGKTNLSEFAYSGLGLNPHYGTPVNPYSDEMPRAPGGSSAGSAIAVAAGLAPVAIGTDTAGSVRVPASFCGLAGFKSSQNRYDKQGVFPLSSSLDSLGPLAHCVDDLIVLDALMRAHAAAPVADVDLADLEFLIPETIVFDEIEADIRASFDEAVDRLKNAGIRISRAPFPIFAEIMKLFAAHGTPTVAEAATFHEALLSSERADEMDQRVRTRMMAASGFSAQDYIRLQWERERLQETAGNILGDKCLLFPTVAMTAPALAPLEADDDFFAQSNLKALRNTILGNYLGMPGVSLPIGVDRKGLPIGALISAPFGQDDRILAVAKAIEPFMQIAAKG
ncbi:amidase [Pararhizobium sp. IMCC21322]|uniref:amidase n=1 Tax=Pararhizobium sp. IMCC21322 TaxID=3067903 RepID=UPI002740AD80|nr:amidase [Pararhizobium sp. IMCC21322]